MPSGGLGHRHPGAVDLAELAQADVGRLGRDLEAVRVNGGHRPRREAGGPAGHLGAADADAAVPEEDLGKGERVRVRPEVEGAHEGRGVLGRGVPVDDRRGLRSIESTEVAPAGEGLLTAAFAPGDDATRQVGEGLEPRRVALRVEREGRLVRSHVEDALLQEPPGVGPRRHLVPRDAVRRLVAEDRPARDVEPRVARQGPVVEVDGQAAHQAEHLDRDHREVRDARQVVEFDPPQEGGKVVGSAYGKPLVRGPALDRRLDRDDGGDAVAEFQEDVAATGEERPFADEDPRVDRHGLTSCPRL